MKNIQFHAQGEGNLFEYHLRTIFNNFAGIYLFFITLIIISNFDHVDTFWDENLINK